ncbi:MAG: hypothetical protein EON98_05460 [Chitinophagaceae bacterium]|nr:MAG: hypothetical protein EON98_05460 [Chitinophagaceae bacterium]
MNKEENNRAVEQGQPSRGDVSQTSHTKDQETEQSSDQGKLDKTEGQMNNGEIGRDLTNERSDQQ